MQDHRICLTKEKGPLKSKEGRHRVAKVDNKPPGPQAALCDNRQGLCLWFQEAERSHGLAWTLLNAWDAAKTGSLEFSEQTLLLKRTRAAPRHRTARKVDYKDPGHVQLEREDVQADINKATNGLL